MLRRSSGQAISSTLFLVSLKRIEPRKHAVVALPRRRLAWSRRVCKELERFSFGLQIGLRIVVGGVETDVPEPASDHRDVHARCDQMDRCRVTEAVGPDVLRGQARRARCAAPPTV